MFAEQLYNELRAKLIVDQLRIDDELSQTPMLLQSAAEAAADAIQLRDACKSELEITWAKAARRLRDAAEKAPSEEKLKTLIPLETDVQHAQQALDDAKRDASYWSALAESMKEKSSNARRIGELLLAGYLTANSVGDLRRAEMNAERQQHGWRPRGKV